MRIPRCMSTQHPDNVDPPFFADSFELGGEDEIEEAYYAFSHLGCDEQMWDAEGKEVDGFVVKKLLSKYEDYFRRHVLGEDLFLTLRVPNPAVERAEAKILLETLESIPRSFDAAKILSQGDVAPIFEVIVPMTSSARDVERVRRYYAEIVVGKQHHRLGDGDMTVAEWVGDFKPERINVIPLYEDLDSMLAAADITAQYLRGQDVGRQRVFLARSDPALNYGMVAAVLANKVALKRLSLLEQQSGVQICPIVGLGSAPFRGGLTPASAGRVLADHPSVHTFTVQSAFKYDHEPRLVRDAVERICAHVPAPPPDLDEDWCLDVIDRTARAYAQQAIPLAPLVQRIARDVPSRRKRKLHVGLFGYARHLGGVTFPRAIAFTAALYSVGLPPELLGLDALTDRDVQMLGSIAPNLAGQIALAARYLNPGTGLVPDGITQALDRLGIDVDPDPEHRAITTQIAERVRDGDQQPLGDGVVRAARLRRFLG